MQLKVDSNRRALALSIAVVLIAVAIGFLESRKPMRAATDDGSDIISRSVSMNVETKEKRYNRAKEISTPDAFINTGKKPDGSNQAITIKEFIGKKVILVDFWTYSCINCQRTTPYLNTWNEKYNDRGLQIISIHTPEFEFEKKYENVQAATEKMGIKYPVVLDNDFSTWQAYKNNYWPRKYLIDIDGFIVYDHIGEGAYQETERRIQELLNERMKVLGEEGGEVGDTLSEVFSDVPRQGGLRSPEIYFGSARNELLANGKRGVVGPQQFSLPATPKLDQLNLVGQWNIQKEYAESKGQSELENKIIFRYRAEDVYFVASAAATTTVEVWRDGVKVGGSAGRSVKNGQLLIKDSDLYHLIHEPLGSSEHTLELRVKGPGLKAFTFTFG